MPVTYDQTHWLPVQQRRPLPTFYYHEHFIEMLDFVGQHYAHVLLEPHVQFIEAFRALPIEAQCLYVRLVNRKGRVFAISRLRYPELGDLRPLLSALQQNGWVGPPLAGHFEDMLAFLTKGEIYKVLLPRFAGLGRSLKKAELVRFARDNVAPDEFTESVNTDRLLVQKRIDESRYLLFLYFGRVQDGLSKFTMRDLGLVRTQDFHESYEPRFNDIAESQEHYYFATRLHKLKGANTAGLQALVAEASAWPPTNFSGSAALRDELAHQLGRAAESLEDLDTAIMIYGNGESARCSERKFRLLITTGSRDEARRHLEHCLENPRSDEEWLIARDLYAQKIEKKKTSAVTDVLRAAETIEIDESQSGAPERAAVDYYEKLGMAAFRTENLLWRTFFGLLFWDELFVSAESAMHSPFETLPASLGNNSFYENSRERIESRLTMLCEDPAAVKRELLRISTKYYGKPNGIFRWRQSMNDALFALIDAADGATVGTVLRRLCQNYLDSRYGYPDLMLVDGDGVRFVEIKAEGDQLRRNQLLRLEQLRSAGFRADVVRVRWVLDPEQAYVVVDVETTGGRGENHRVTEIGAVKVRGGRVVDRFQTLLNPQRVIPANITRLTGISAAMVDNAPFFIDIADEFEDFMKDSIFVAHNVEFDYGFISSEYRRIGRQFRHPKLCTCASMRKLYPGQKSYSLAALSRAFDISLKQHHRAMCDAEAAAELLLLINEKRQAG